MLALEAVQALEKCGYEIKETAIRKGLRETDVYKRQDTGNLRDYEYRHCGRHHTGLGSLQKPEAV